MINVSDGVREYLLSDSTTKEIDINARVKSMGTTDYTNYYKGDILSTTEHLSTTTWDLPSNLFPKSTNWKDYVDYTLAASRDYFCISFEMSISNYASTELTDMHMDIHVVDDEGHSLYYPDLETFNVSDYIDKTNRFYFTTPYFKLFHLKYITNIVFYSESIPFVGDVTVSNIQVEYSDDASELPRDYCVEITNDNLCFEEFKYKESLCSQDNIKFGLCESSNTEFSVVNLNNAILKDATLDIYEKNPEYIYRRIKAIDFHNDSTGTMTPTTVYNDTRNGVFSYYIDLTDKLINTSATYFGKYAKIYNYVYLALKMSITNLDIPSGIDAPYYFRPGMLVTYEDNYSGYWSSDESFIKISDLLDGYCYMIVGVQCDYYKQPGRTDHGDITEISKFRLYMYDENKNRYTPAQTFNISVSIKEMGLYVIRNDDVEKPIPYDPNMALVYNGGFDDYIADVETEEEGIPFGRFKVSEVKSSIDHLLTKKTITAYDDIIKLEANAADWYAQYMFGIDFYGDTGYHGFEFARQIYSTYYDYIVKVGNDSPNNYSQTTISTIANANIVNYLSNKKVKYNDALNYYIRYSKITISTPVTRRYRVIFDTVDVGYLKVWMSDYYDPLWRGILNANVLIEETRTTGTNRYVVDAWDMYMISPDCTSFNIYVPYDYYDGDNNVSIKKLITSDITILQVNDDIDLENGYIRLLYYDWNTKEIFESDTSITGRDVVRSLLEPCGCFYRMNRETNIPEFVYCTKGGLYPSETLYPADDLYPRTGTDVQLTVGKYMSFTRGETQVQNFGKIQIRKGGTIKDAESVCEWQYTGDENSLNTYIIEDNIFYCNDKLTYSADMTEVAEMLEKMWLRISNMGYVSNITEALGMPWVQCGDRVGIFTIDGGAETFIFRRTLSGIQLMKDTYESNGDEYNKAISNYNFGG